VLPKCQIAAVPEFGGFWDAGGAGAPLVLLLQSHARKLLESHLCLGHKSLTLTPFMVINSVWQKLLIDVK
jgi:hypothetical protein